MGDKQKRAIDKTDEWAAWLWANAKIDTKSFAFLKKTINISKEDMEDYNQAMFTHVMDIIEHYWFYYYYYYFHSSINVMMSSCGFLQHVMNWKQTLKMQT